MTTVLTPVETMTSLPSVPVMVPVEPSMVAGWPWQTAAACAGPAMAGEREGGRYDEDGGQCDT